MEPVKAVNEIIFNRSPITLADSIRLQDGNDLNDALLDFFTKLGTALVADDVQSPCAYTLSSLFYGKLSGGNAKSGEEGWENVKSWTRRIKPGLLRYPAIAVPINETLIDPDNKKKTLGNHWWLALVLNPENAARGKQCTVVCLDSMKRRTTSFEEEPHAVEMRNTPSNYKCEVTKIEQAAHRLWVNFDVQGDGTMGELADARLSRIKVDNEEVVGTPELALTINNNGPNQPCRFEGQLEFHLDGRCRASTFEFTYANSTTQGTYPPIEFTFDAFNLSKMQKTVTRLLGGFLKKEWGREVHKAEFDKKRVRAAMLNTPQQENLYDCGVFVLENVLTALQKGKSFIDKLTDDPTTEEDGLWPGQAEVKHRRTRLCDCLLMMFQACAQAGGNKDIGQLMEKDPELREKVRECLTDLPGENQAKRLKTEA